MRLAMLNDRLLAYDQLDPIYLDRAFFFGDGVYEVVRSAGGRLFAWQEHLDRFRRSLEAVGLDEVDLDEIRRRVERAYAESGLPEAKIYFHVTRGSADRDLAGSTGGPQFFLTVTELPDATAEKTRGIAVSTFPDWRWKRCDIKSLNLLANVLARRDAAKKGCQEAILVDEQGWITEGAGSGFFAVFPPARPGGRPTLQTTPLTANILASVTRQYVLRAAEELDLSVVEQSYTVAQAREASELFLAVTTKDVVPVVRFDGAVVGDGTPGPVTRDLMECFQRFYRSA